MGVDVDVFQSSLWLYITVRPISPSQPNLQVAGSHDYSMSPSQELSMTINKIIFLDCLYTGRDALSVVESYDWIFGRVRLGSIKPTVRRVYIHSLLLKPRFPLSWKNPCGPFNLKVLFTALYTKERNTDFKQSISLFVQSMVWGVIYQVINDDSLNNNYLLILSISILLPLLLPVLLPFSNNTSLRSQILLILHVGRPSLWRENFIWWLYV